MRTILLCVALLAVCGALVRAQSDDVKRDLKDVEDRATKPFEQYEREDAMRRLGKSGEAAAISKLISLLRDDFVNIRTAAARILVTAQGEVDAALLKEGLAHKDAEVRRRSADVLGKRKAASAVEALGKTLRADKDEAVRVACARALGRIGGTDAEAALEKVLKSGDAASGEAAAALGRAGRQDLAGKLADALKAKSAEGVVGALDGLAVLGVAHEHLAAIAKTAGHKDWRVRIACAQALGTITAIADEDAARKVLAQLLADDDWRVRRRTIEALVDLWQPLGAALLAERLPKEETALFMDIVHALEDLTGSRHGYMREAWTRWWEGIGSKAELAKRKPRPAQGWLRAPSEGAAGKGEGATATYFKIPVFAQPAAFVFDMSGSMRDPVSRDNGKLRIDLAREELARTLASMPEGASFNLVIFRYYSEFPVRTEVQRAFSKGVASVNAKHIELANKWIEGMPAVGWGAFYEGIAASLEDPAVQVLYFMSDGAPSRGEFTDRDELVEAVAALRRFSPVVLHTVLVGGGNRDEEFMKTLAESCGGTMADARK